MRLFFLLIFVVAGLTACQTQDLPPSPNPLGMTVVPSRPSPSPSLIPSPLPPRIEDCPDAPPIRLIVQEKGRSTRDNAESINLRDGPGTNFAILSRIEAGENFYVLDGPTCAESFTWFRVRYRGVNGSYIGWIAEGDFRNYYVEPYLQG